MYCKHCELPLKDSQERGGYKSCPKCSRRAGEHIYYPKSSFGFTEKRVTANHPDGIQSYCEPCRGTSTGPYPGHKKCSEV